MSREEWPERDEELDLLLADLGTPEGAEPRATPAEILGRAALLAPPVVVGLRGWRLAATLAAAVGGGFLAGLLAREAPAEKAGIAVATIPVPLIVEAPEAAPVAAEPPLATSPSPPPAPARRRPGVAAAPEREAPAPVASALAVACPEIPAEEPPSPLAPEDLAAISALLPARRDEPAPAPEPRVAEGPAEDEQAPRLEAAREKGRLEALVSAGALVAPRQASGVVAAAGLRRGLAEGDARGLTLSGGADLGLLSGGPGPRWTTGLGLDLDHAWKGERAEVELGLSGGLRALLPVPDAERQYALGLLDEQDLEAARLVFVPQAGPTLAAAFGSGDNRLRLDLSAALSPDAKDGGVQPWFSLSVGSAFGLGGRKES